MIRFGSLSARTAVVFLAALICAPVYGEEVEWQLRDERWCLVASRNQACIHYPSKIGKVHINGAHLKIERGDEEPTIFLSFWFNDRCGDSGRIELASSFVLTDEKSIGDLVIEEYETRIGTRPDAKVKTYMVIHPDLFSIHIAGAPPETVAEIIDGFARDWSSETKY